MPPPLPLRLCVFNGAWRVQNYNEVSKAWPVEYNYPFYLCMCVCVIVYFIVDGGGRRSVGGYLPAQCGDGVSTSSVTSHVLVVWSSRCVTAKPPVEGDGVLCLCVFRWVTSTLADLFWHELDFKIKYQIFQMCPGNSKIWIQTDEFLKSETTVCTNYSSYSNQLYIKQSFHVHTSVWVYVS